MKFRANRKLSSRMRPHYRREIVFGLCSGAIVLAIHLWFLLR
jgi:hypothetical protein